MGIRPAPISSLFFFQAEDGIRDPLVTGVQTCALPICALLSQGLCGSSFLAVAEALAEQGTSSGRILFLCSHEVDPEKLVAPDAAARWRKRSEERRVGKECRSGWWAEPEKR